MVYLLLVLSSLASAQTRTNLFTKEPAKSAITSDKGLTSPAKTQKARKSAQHDSSPGGNLDHEILVRHSKYRGDETGLIIAKNLKTQVFPKLRVGEVLQAEILESAIAFPDSKAPLRARVLSGPLKGAILLGEASLERNSKRILIDFRTFRTERGDDDYTLKASALDMQGILGLVGEYNSKEARFFGATFLASVASAFADASVNRSQNAFGNYVEEPGTDTITKKAAASSLSKTAELFAERIKTAPEYSILEGPVFIQVLVTGQPTLER